ncbi:MAG TPA: MBL fold metallo-hydrolase [Actinomycetota bacterium]|nr:MBL fold metallo-hydrolase [Actinomycetota bacterium]
MELIVLGSHGTWPSAGGATSGHLVRHDGHAILLDLGTGTVANLQRHAGLFEVDAVVISHSHPDHVTDLYTYYMARRFSPQCPPPIPLYLAPKVLDRVEPLLSDDSGDMKLAQAFDVRVAEPGHELEAGPFRVTTADMAHSVPTIGVRVEADGAVLAYTADTGPTEHAVRMARDADLLVSEATWQEDEGDRPPIHLTAREAGELASAAGAGRVVLTHIRPHLDRNRSREEAAGAFHGDVLLAEDGLRLDVGGA